MTERLYFTDAELLTFDATVVEQVGDDRHVVLDRTAFYPTSGGQPHDTGVLGDARVVDVIDDGDRIIHVLDAARAYGPVHGEIDAARRRDHMQQHSAQHLLSALAADRFGWSTESVHFGDSQSTIEFGTASVATEQLDQLEHDANTIVAESRPVIVSFETAEDARATGLRKPTDRRGEIRVITIAGVDRSACGGTHVKHTSGIGVIACTGVERVRGHVRLGFVAGGRVVAQLRANRRLVDATALAVGCAPDELPALAARRGDALREATARIGHLEGEVAAARIASLLVGRDGDLGELVRVVYRCEHESPTLLRAMAHAASLKPQLVLVIVIDAPPSVVVGASADSGVDAGALLKQSLASVGGRGGGSARVAQGTVPDLAALERVVAQLSDRA
jgi:alanyl-tRNA synthetase